MSSSYVVNQESIVFVGELIIESKRQYCEVVITSRQMPGDRLMPDPGSWALMGLIDALDRKISVSIELKHV